MYLYHLSKPIMRTQSDRYKCNYVTNQILKTVIYRKSSKFIGQIYGYCFWNSHLGPYFSDTSRFSETFSFSEVY